jgi:hypothetical protein
MQEPAPTPDNAHTARLRLALERELRPDETVQWHGWQLAQLDLKQFGMYLFAIPWTAFSVIAAMAIASAGDDGPGIVGWAFPLFGVPFVAVGIGMLAAPFVPLYQKGRVLYVVTDQRVLKLSLGRELSVNVVPAERIGLVDRRERPDGSGVLQLAVKIGVDSEGDRSTEKFIIGAVADVLGAQKAISRIAHSSQAAATAAAGAPLASS